MIAAFPARQRPEDEPRKLGFRWSVRARTIGAFFIRSHIGEAPLHLHRGKSPLDGPRAGGALGYPAFAGFELEDGIYLIGPDTWLGGLLPCFIISSVGTLFFSRWTLRKFVGKTGACQGP